MYSCSWDILDNTFYRHGLKIIFCLPLSAVGHKIMQLYFSEAKLPVNWFQDEGKVGQWKQEIRLHSSVEVIWCAKSEYNNASTLSGGRNITVHRALFCTKKLAEKQPVSLADGIWGQSNCNARHNYQSKTTCRGTVAVNAKWSLQPPHSCLNGAVGLSNDS